jgi:serine/threonine-protein kinase HipA
MRAADVFVHGQPAGRLEEVAHAIRYRFIYRKDYNGPPVSLTMPLSKSDYLFDRLPPFFEGLLPEGIMLEGLLKQNKIDRHDYFGQLLAVGADMVGAVTVREASA